MTDRDRLVLAVSCLEMEVEIRNRIGNPMSTSEFVQRVAQNLEGMQKYDPGIEAKQS